MVTTFNLRHNKYVSIPDWFKDTNSNVDQPTEDKINTAIGVSGGSSVVTAGSLLFTLYNKYVLKPVTETQSILTIKNKALIAVTKEEETTNLGDEVGAQGWNTSDYFDIAAETLITVTGQTNDQYGIVFYNNAKQVINAVPITSSPIEIMTPIDAFYCRISSAPVETFSITYYSPSGYTDSQLNLSNQNVTDYLAVNTTIPEGYNMVSFEGNTFNLLVQKPLTLTKDNNNVIKLSLSQSSALSDGVWELRTDELSNQLYIYTIYPVVTQYGITTYADVDNLDIDSIYNGLPIDNQTIYWEETTTQVGTDENGNPIYETVKILKANGGGSGGGVADSVAWNNIIGKPNFASVATSGKYGDLTGRPTLLSLFTDDVVSGKYLSLRGGTISGDLFVANSYGGVVFTNTSNNSKAFLFYNGNADWYVTNEDWGAGYKIWHEGNDGSGNGLDADMLDGKHNGELTSINMVRCGSGILDANALINSEYLFKYYAGIASSSSNIPTYSGYQNALLEIPLHTNGATSQFYFSYGKNPYYRAGVDKSWNEIAYKTDNVASATKLQIARTIWGQSFDGTGNVSGVLSGVDGITFNSYNAVSVDYNSNFVFKQPNTTALQDWSIQKNDTTKIFMVRNDGNVGIGTTSPSSELHVLGDILTTGGITMYSQRSLKNVVDERGLSLSELSTIKPIRYTWKDGRDNRLHFGGIADDIEQVLPEVVYKTSEGILTMDYGNAAFAVAASLIKPVVDHEKRIAMLQERIVELEEEVERLKSA